MLTTKNITPHQGKNYYTKENYYTHEEQQENSRWMGLGAASLGLKGLIEGEIFFKLLHGYLPNGSQFRSKPTQKNYKERAGLDCTFSAPKSVSILALVANDLRLEKAHQKAVERTLAIIEPRYAATRVKDKNRRKPILTGNLVVAKFDHDTSRELDPHLHSHCVILNMTKLSSGKWQSLYNDDIHSNKKLLGMIYQNELALEVQKLGYTIENTGNGQFEISGFKREQIEYFSKRHEQIKALVKEGLTWGEKELVWAKTRIKKGDPIPRHELQEYWNAEAKKLGIEFPSPVLEAFATWKKEISQTQSKIATSPKKTVREAVAQGIGHCSERLVAFKPSEIEKFVLSEVGNYSLDEIERMIAQSDELLYLDDKRVTTQEAIKREIATILLMEEGKGQVKSIANPDFVSSYLEEKGLTSGQLDAISLSATTKNQFIAWQGVAGSGKTYALNQLKEIAIEQNYIVKGFAPSSAAAEVLADELGIETTTTARLLFSKQSDNPSPNQIWIVDEAGLLSAVDGYDLLRRAQTEQARVILVGDTRQQGAVEAGSPFRSLQQAGIATAYLDESLRQKTADLKESVKLISEGHLEQGMHNLDKHGRITVIEDEQHLINQIASDYLALAPNDREKTLVLTGTNDQRLALAQCIRDGLKAEGRLGALGVTVTQLLKKDLTEVQMGYAHHYSQGDVVAPIWEYKRLGLSKEQLYTVVGKNKDTLTLQSNDGATFLVNPAHFRKAVYSQSLIEIAPGDKMKWTRNERHLKRHNGLEFTVKSLAPNALTAQIQYRDGREDNIDLTRAQHLDYTVVTTNYSSQGKSADRVLVAAVNAIDSESFYVAVSRVKHDLKLYTHDMGKLIDSVLKSRAQENPIELLKYQVREQIKNEEERAASSLSTDPEEHLTEFESKITFSETIPPIEARKAYSFELPPIASNEFNTLPEPELKSDIFEEAETQKSFAAPQLQPEPSIDSLPIDFSYWKRAAIAVGRNEQTQKRIEIAEMEFKNGELTSETLTHFSSDINSYFQTNDNLKAWQEAALALNRSSEYIQRIYFVTMNFLAKNPKPLSPKAVQAMKRDLKEYSILQLNRLEPRALWERFSAGIDTEPEAVRIKEIAKTALKNGVDRENVRFMLLESPFFKDIENQKGRIIALRLARGAVISVLDSDPQYQMRKEAFEISEAARKFLYWFGTFKSGDVMVFEGNKYLLEADLKAETTTITAKAGMRLVLRVEKERVITFNPTPEERMHLLELPKDVAELEKQARSHSAELEIERDRERARGFSR